jgi:hypothetical protein
MKITEILVESQHLEEGPLLNKIGSAVGKAAGTVAKGVGAVAGGIAGVGSAIKKGWNAGKSTVAGAGDDVETDPNAPAATGKTPAATAPGGGAGAQPSATNINAAGPKGTAPAQNLKGAAKVAADKTAAVTQDQNATQAGQTVYAQVKANIDKLDKKGKQRILQLLQKSVAAPEQKPAAPTAPAGGAPAADAGAGAMGQMAGQLAKGGAAEPNTMANAPVSKTNTAKPGNPNAAPAAEPTAAPAAEPTAAPAVTTKKTGGRVKGQLSQDPRAVKRREANAAKQQATEPKKKPAAPDQATIDAERERIMGPTSDSIIRTRPMMAESFSLFRKR